MRGLLLYLKSLLQNIKLYWNLLSKVNSIRLRISNWRFKDRRKFEDSKYNFSIIRDIVFLAFGPIILAFLLSILLILINNYFASLDTKIMAFSIALDINFIFDLIPANEIATYDGILIAIVTVIGLFLTLFITNLGTLAGTLFTSLPGQLRNLYIKEKVGNIYIKYLINVILVSLIFLGFGLILNIRTKFILLGLGLLSLVSIQSFVFLSEYSFQLFDPTFLIGNLEKQLYRWTYYSTYNGFNWQDIAFQNYFSENANKIIVGISTLVQIARDEKYLKRESYLSLLAKISSILRKYLVIKNTIPTKSLWFRKKPEYKPWYLSDYLAVNLASSTQTELMPEKIPDLNWIERELFANQLLGLKDFLEQRDTKASLRILDNVANVFEAFGRNWEISYGSTELIVVSNLINDFVISDNPKNLDEYNSNELFIVDYLGLFPITLLVELRKTIANWKLIRFWKLCNELNWKNPKSIYKINIPSIALDEIEKLQDRLQFEIKTEGKIISAKWYQRQLISYSISNHLINQLNDLLSVSMEIYGQSDLWIQKNQFAYAAELIKRGLEFHEKALNSLNEISRFLEELQNEWKYKFRVVPKFSEVEIQSKLIENIDKLNINYSLCIPGLLTQKRNKNIPDYFGRLIHITQNNVFRSLIEDDVKKFSTLFPNYFVGAMHESDLLKSETSDWDVTGSVRAFSQPLIDLVELSGYCYFFSELHDNPKLWNMCKGFWEKYIDNSVENLILLALIISIYKNSISISIRSTNWKQIIENKLNKMPRNKKLLGSASAFPRYTAYVEHKSPIVRLFGGPKEDYRVLHYDGVDVFIDIFLKTIPESKDLDFGGDAGLLKALERLKQNQNNGEV